MKYIKFKIPENTTKIEKENLIVKYFFIALSYVLKLIIPKGNPDFDKQIDNVEYWLLECEIESGIPEREIGVDNNGNVIVKMPFKDNCGYWTDHNLIFNDFIEKFKATEIEKSEFEFNWKNLKESNKNIVGKERQNEFEYVYVEQNGKVRELDKEEIEYLSKTFLPNDGGRPYIKTKYEDITPEGKIWGFIRRNRIPKNVIIEKEQENT